MVIGHFPFRFDHGLRVSADPVENLVAARQGPGFGTVVEVGLGGCEAAEAAARPGMVEGLAFSQSLFLPFLPRAGSSSP